MVHVKKQPLVLAYGLGRDSTAILVGWQQRGIVPDHIVFADVGSEKDETYAYLDVIGPWLAKHGFPQVTIVKYVPLAKTPYTTIEGNCTMNCTLPSEAFGFGACTCKWKIAPQEKWAKKEPTLAEVFEKDLKITKAIGYEFNELSRKAKMEKAKENMLAKEQRENEERKLAGKTAKKHSSSDDHYEYVYPLIEWEWTLERCIEEIAGAGLPVPPKSSCFFCLTGDTLVATAEGLRPIRELAGTTANLLVPTRNGNYKTGVNGGREYHTRGSWRKVPVRAYGAQRIYEVHLARGRSRRVVRTTDEHRWYLDDGVTVKCTTMLSSGDVLDRCMVTTNGKVVPSAVGVMHGVVYGDGTRGQGGRPASLRLYGTKAGDLSPLFSNCRFKDEDGKPTVKDLPRQWKDLPSTSESRSYLLGWLAGYAATDGHLTTGAASLELTSVNAEAIECVRSVCMLLGIQCGMPAESNRTNGFKPHTLHRVNLRVTDIPSGFWIRHKHKEAIAKRGAGHPSRARNWKVVKVVDTGKLEQVYCATVEGAQRFVLDGDLVTGNCPNMRPDEVRTLGPEQLGRIMRMEIAAEPYNQKIHGLWRKPRKRDGRPGSITEFIIKEGLEFIHPDDLQDEMPMNPNCGKFDRGFTFYPPHRDHTLRELVDHHHGRKDAPDMFDIIEHMAHAEIVDSI